MVSAHVYTKKTTSESVRSCYSEMLKILGDIKQANNLIYTVEINMTVIYREKASDWLKATSGA